MEPSNTTLYTLILYISASLAMDGLTCTMHRRPAAHLQTYGEEIHFGSTWLRPRSGETRTEVSALLGCCSGGGLAWSRNANQATASLPSVRPTSALYLHLLPQQTAARFRRGESSIFLKLQGRSSGPLWGSDLRPRHDLAQADLLLRQVAPLPVKTRSWVDIALGADPVRPLRSRLVARTGSDS